jgi:hypothetical protein
MDVVRRGESRIRPVVGGGCIRQGEHKVRPYGKREKPMTDLKTEHTRFNPAIHHGSVAQVGLYPTCVFSTERRIRSPRRTLSCATNKRYIDGR